MKLFNLLAVVLSAALSACGGGGDPADTPEQPQQSEVKPPEFNLMSYGFTILDSTGGIVASESTKSLHYIGKASGGAMGPYVNGFGAYLEYTITSPGGPPLPFVEAAPGVSFAVKGVINTTGPEYKIYIQPESGVVPVLKVHCFAPITPAQLATGYGAQVFMGDGSVALSTLNKPLLLDGYTTITQVNAGDPVITDTGTWTSLSGATYSPTTMSRPAFSSFVGGAKVDQSYHQGPFRIINMVMRHNGDGLITVGVGGLMYYRNIPPFQTTAFVTPDVVLFIDAARYD